MERFVQYLYEYQKDQRVRNVGFIKGEFEERKGRIVLQAKGICPEHDRKLNVFLFYPKGEYMETVFQGSIPKEYPILNKVLKFDTGDLGEAMTTEELAGILLREENGTCYISVWKEVLVDVEKLEECQSVATNRICRKIEKSELAKLPRAEWHLVNNHFLSHGFSNYHHLLWLQEDGKVAIGVPGIYHAREMQAAKAFGFEEYCSAKELGVGTEDGFGYYLSKKINVNSSRMLAREEQRK